MIETRCSDQWLKRMWDRGVKCVGEATAPGPPTSGALASEYYPNMVYRQCKPFYCVSILNYSDWKHGTS